MGESGGTPPGRVHPRGNIEKLSSGALRVRVHAGIDVLTGRRLYLKQFVAPGKDARARAERVCQELVRQVEEGRQPRTNGSLAQLLEAHLASSPVQKRVRQTQRGYLDKHVLPLIGNRPLGTLKAEVLEAFYAELRRCRDHCGTGAKAAGGRAAGESGRGHGCRPLAASTVRQIHYLISAAYESAIRWDWVAVNPVRRTRKPAAPAPDPQPPTTDEAAALLDECWRRGFGPMVWVAMTTGARRGELCALRWRHLQAIHTVRGDHDCVAAECKWQLVVRRAIGEGHDGELWESDTKTHQRRHIALDPETVAVLLEHRGRCEELARQLATRVTGTVIFAGTPDGAKPSRPSTVSQRYQRCAERLGIDTTLKNLRHYSATELITAGVDIRTVAGRLGHSGGGVTTLRVYAAWMSAADQHASAALMNRMPQRPAIPTEADQARTRPRLAELTGDLDEIVTEALAAARALPPPYRCPELTWLATGLTGPDRMLLLAEAEEAARTVDDPDRRLTLLRNLVPLHDGAERNRLVQAALTTPVRRAPTLLPELAPLIPTTTA